MGSHLVQQLLVQRILGGKPACPIREAGLESWLCPGPSFLLWHTMGDSGDDLVELLLSTWETWIKFSDPGFDLPKPLLLQGF